MLEQLTIRNFAIIDRLDLRWDAGLSVITGETGAGKSIIIDAIGALLGDRLGAEVVRSGADRALVEGVFVLPPEPSTELAGVLEEYGLEPEDGALIVTREVAAAGGRGGARVNGRTVPLAVLAALGEQLVDVHGQSEHMALLRPREQLELLDRYAGTQELRAEVARLVGELRATRAARLELDQAEQQAEREQELLRHTVEEIRAAEVREGEEEELQAARARLEHVERLRAAATAAHDALAGADEGAAERPGAVELLGEAVEACEDGARFDPTLAAQVDALNAALAQADEALRWLRDYADGLESDPAALERLEERLFQLAELRRKYGGSLGAVLAELARAEERLDRWARRDEERAELARREGELARALGAAAEALSDRRAAAGTSLAEAVQRELADLRLTSARFAVALTQRPDDQGVPVRGRPVAFDATGADRVELLLAANAGEELRPLQRVASGGELARIALAIKTVLARADTRATLIFDEIDMGVGGRTAPVVGEKLWRVAEAGHQVFCITHMPQVAAFADQHLVVAKQEVDGRTRTTVRQLEGADPVEELAAMLAGGVSAASRASALELLNRAGRVKRADADGASGEAPAPPGPPARRGRAAAASLELGL